MEHRRGYGPRSRHRNADQAHHEHHYFSWQSTSTLLVTPLVTSTGPEALQSAVPPSYFGFCPETVYVPTGTGTENRPFAPTEMRYLVPFDSRRVTCPLRTRGPKQPRQEAERAAYFPEDVAGLGAIFEDDGAAHVSGQRGGGGLEDPDRVRVTVRVQGQRALDLQRRRGLVDTGIEWPRLDAGGADGA
jgi:hypothetical protein